jgi:hypothetical protein
MEYFITSKRERERERERRSWNYKEDVYAFLMPPYNAFNKLNVMHVVVSYLYI